MSESVEMFKALKKLIPELNGIDYPTKVVLTIDKEVTLSIECKIYNIIRHEVSDE